MTVARVPKVPKRGTKISLHVLVGAREGVMVNRKRQSASPQNMGFEVGLS